MVRASRILQAPGDPEPRLMVRDPKVTPAIHALRRSAGHKPSPRTSSRLSGRGMRPLPAGRLSYTITMRSIIPASGALASATAPRTDLKATDDRAHDRAAYAAAMMRDA